MQPLRLAALASLGLLTIACGDDDEAAGGGGSAAASTAETTATSVTGSGATSSTSGTGTSTTGAAGSGGSGGQGSSGQTVGPGAGGGGQGGGGAAPPVSCDECGQVTDLGSIASPQIDELSGLAASRLHDGVLFGNDDSGEDPVIFAFTLAGEDRGTYPLQGATARDWEDMAAGPCGDGAPGCLYVADIGDNAEGRNDLVLYRVREPASLGAGLQPALPIETFPFSYPDGPHNAEAVVVHPGTGVVTIITKGDAPALFELVPPLAAGMVATRIGDYVNPSSVVTGADVDPFGATIAIRTYTGVFLYPIVPGASAASALLVASCTAPSGLETQGETVAWLTEGRAYVTASEGAAAVIHRVGCP